MGFKENSAKSPDADDDMLIKYDYESYCDSVRVELNTYIYLKLMGREIKKSF